MLQRDTEPRIEAGVLRHESHSTIDDSRQRRVTDAAIETDQAMTPTGQGAGVNRRRHQSLAKRTPRHLARGEKYDCFLDRFYRMSISFVFIRSVFHRVGRASDVIRRHNQISL